ncbi:glycosyltransferase family 2 protein [Bacillus songklensis]|uniref:Glycosyltransferase family 2 protein n=1 Tax=Bacillus songklensis TaxID=1069116 RepID=A0ABV8BAU3_9BACI
MVSIVCCSMRQNFMENVFQNYERQAWKEKELIIILNKDNMDITKWEERAKQSQGVSVYQLSEEVTLGECLNYGIEKAKYDFIAKFDDDDYYAPHYLAQSMEALEEMNADIVGKRTVYMYFENLRTLAIHRPGNENMFVEGELMGATLLFKKEISEQVRFRHKNKGEDSTFLRKCRTKGYRMYSTDKCHYACLRASTPEHHTWRKGTKSLLKNSSIVCETDDYKSLVQCTSADSE